MHKKLQEAFANVTQEQIKIYLALCETCQLKKPKMRKSLVVKPILSKRMNERCQVTAKIFKKFYFKIFLKI